MTEMNAERSGISIDPETAQRAYADGSLLRYDRGVNEAALERAFEGEYAYRVRCPVVGRFDRSGREQPGPGRARRRRAAHSSCGW